MAARAFCQPPFNKGLEHGRFTRRHTTSVLCVKSSFFLGGVRNETCIATRFWELVAARARTGLMHFVPLRVLCQATLLVAVRRTFLWNDANVGVELTKCQVKNDTTYTGYIEKKGPKFRTVAGCLIVGVSPEHFEKYHFSIYPVLNSNKKEGNAW